MEAQIAGTPLMDYAIPEICWDYLNRMRDLCREKGIELILVKAPTNFWKYYWYDEWEEQIVSYAEEHQLSYYNFIPLAEEIGLDWSVDTYDGGAHLNVTGAEKLTSYFGAILREDHGIADRRGEEALLLAWNEKTERYRWEKTEATHE